MACRGAFVFALLVVLQILSLPVSAYENNTDGGTMALGRWYSGGATWNGSPHGDGSEGGACGYQKAVGQRPFSSMVAGGGPSIFQNGKGCGACYQVKCYDARACSGEPVTVVITDSCPSCPADKKAFFDMSGTAFGAMANNELDDRLRNVGIVDIQYRKVSCKYGTNVVFKVDAASNPYYFAVLIEYENGDGDLKDVHIMEQGDRLSAMDHSWGATWSINSKDGKPLRPPFSIWLTSGSGHELVAEDVIPSGWQPGSTYISSVNYAA